MINYTPVIGLEVHVELSTKSKMFCSCPASYFGKKPNTQVCPVCLGLPGALPFANKKAIEHVIKMGLALKSSISNQSKLDRKHYFYPDLPKSYQISQYDLPLCRDGELMGIKVRRIHIEEDTGKLQHVDGVTLIDFNRSSVPLMELVTEPDFNNSDDVVNFLKEIQRIVRYLGISEADMEKGSMRLEANISLRKETDANLPDYKVELKNINSFRFVKAAIEAEIERQTQNPSERYQETRGYDEKTKTTFLQRRKEEANDYRYFPEPDVPAFYFSNEEINKIGKEIPELPEDKRKKYKSFGIPDNYIEILVDDKKRGEYLEECIRELPDGIVAKDIAGLMINQNLDKQSLSLRDKDYISPAQLVKKVYELLKKDYANDTDTKATIEKVIAENKKAVGDFQSGKGEVVGFLIGQVQRELKGKGEPKLVQSLLRKLLMK